MPNPSGMSETSRHPEFYITGGDLYLLVSLLPIPPGIQHPPPCPENRIIVLRFVWGINYGCSTSIKIPHDDLWDTTCCVDNVYFCVPSYLFTREARSVFRELIKPSPSPGVTIPGRTHANAILLTGVKSEDLTTLLRVVLNPKYTDFSFMTVSNWITTLNLAHKWKFDNLIAAAIRELHKADLDIISRIELYMNNGVHVRYIFPLYADLCQIDGTALNWQEARRVGSYAAFAIMQTRETMFRTFPPVVVSTNEPPRNPRPSEIPRASIFRILKEILEIGDIVIDDHPALQGTANETTQATSVDPNAGSSTARLGRPLTGSSMSN